MQHNVIVNNKPFSIDDLKVVNYLLCSNGVFRVDKRTSGLFSSKLTAKQLNNPMFKQIKDMYEEQDITTLNAGKEGLLYTLPKIPSSIYSQILSFFNYYAKQGFGLEAMANIYVDRELNYFVDIPEHVVTRKLVDYKMHNIPGVELIVSMHSHHYYPPQFSPRDNRDQLQTGIYCVAGYLNRPKPVVTSRIFCSDYVEVNTASIFEMPENCFEVNYPKEWHGNISLKNHSII